MAQPKNQFDVARKRLRQQEITQGQEAERALKRQFARAGGLGSGAYIKQLGIAKSKIGEQAQSGREAIQSAELRELERRKEIEEGRKFASGEAEKGRQFAKAEGATQRTFQKGMFDVEQKFRQQQAEFQNNLARFGQTTKLKQLDLAKQQFDLEKDIAAFNKEIALAELNKPTDLFASLLGPSLGFGKGGFFSQIGGTIGGLF